MKRIVVLVISVLMIFSQGAVFPISANEPQYSQWIKVFNSRYFDYVRDLKIVDDRIIAVGQIGWIDDIIKTIDDNRGFLMELDLNGEVQEMNIFVPPAKQHLELQKILLEDDGYLLLFTNYLYSQRDGVLGFDRIYLVKLDREKKIQWVKTYGCQAQHAGQFVKFQDGYYLLLHNIGLGISARIAGKLGLIKFNEKGNVIYAKVFSSSDYSIDGNVVVADDQRLFLGGSLAYRRGTTKENELFLLELNKETGQIKWIKSYGKDVASLSNFIYLPLEKTFLFSIRYCVRGEWTYWSSLIKLSLEGELIEAKKYSLGRPSLITSTADGFYWTGVAKQGFSLMKMDFNGKPLIFKRIAPFCSFSWPSLLQEDSSKNVVLAFETAAFPDLNYVEPAYMSADIAVMRLNRDLEIPYSDNDWVYDLPLPTPTEITTLKPTNHQIKESELSVRPIIETSNIQIQKVPNDSFRIIDVARSKLKITVVYSPSEGGGIQPVTAVVDYNSSITFTITPNEGYKIEEVLVDGVSVGAVTTYDFESITSSHTIEAVFKPITYTINTSSGIGGSISPSGTVTVDCGDSKTFTITPYSGYKISNVKVDGTSVGTVSSYTFTNITSGHTISVTFEKEITKTVIILHPDNPYMTVNGNSKEIDPGRGTTPIIIAKWSRTVVPIRAIVEEVGGTIYWENTTRKVTINFGNTTIELWIDNPKARVNGEEKWIDNNNHDVKPIIVNSRTMLPLRFIAESLGCDVDWDEDTRTITITCSGGG